MIVRLRITGKKLRPGNPQSIRLGITMGKQKLSHNASTLHVVFHYDLYSHDMTLVMVYYTIYMDLNLKHRFRGFIIVWRG